MRQATIRNNAGLEWPAIQAAAPSIFAEAPSSRVSARYTQIPTVQVVRGLVDAGWVPVSAGQSRARLEERRAFTKHQLRLRHPGHIGAAVGDSVPEIVLTNSHDGSSSYQLTAGLFRLVCANGLVASGNAVTEQRVRHSGDVVAEVVEGATRILDQFGRVIAARDEMQRIEVSGAEQLAFATAAAQIKFEGEDGALTIRPAQLLTPRRREDAAPFASAAFAKPDLWTTFNVVQENMIRGGLRPKSGGRTRAVQSIDQDTKINKALWTLAEEMAKLKA